MSYGRLEEWVRATAHRLGPDPGTVGVLTSRSAHNIVAMLGVFSAGGTYCPIDPTFPPARRAAMLSAAGCRIVLATRADQPTPPGVPRVELTDPQERAGSAVPLAGSAEDPAYILFTSGSTGSPKPVVTPRRAIAATVRSLHDLFGLTPADRVLQFASLNWDTCFEEILPTLTSGGSLVFHDDAYSGSFPRFLRMIERERITLLDLPTAFWHELVHHLAEDRASLPGCVRVVVIGGEAARPARLAEWCALDTDRVRLINTYGCTETTLITHAVDLHGPRAASVDTPWDQAVRVPIGSALPHVLEHIADGELLIGGPAVALGYRGLLADTEARFITLDGGRFFRTGDAVSRSDEGIVTYEGRLDMEVKVRGIRVDPAEVESHIGGHSDVSAVAVAGVTVAGRMTLAAHVVARPHADTSVLAAEILAYLRARVPGHLVPGRITVVRELVYTASGKIDRARSMR